MTEFRLIRTQASFWGTGYLQGLVPTVGFGVVLFVVTQGDGLSPTFWLALVVAVPILAATFFGFTIRARGVECSSSGLIVIRVRSEEVWPWEAIYAPSKPRMWAAALGGILIGRHALGAAPPSAAAIDSGQWSVVQRFLDLHPEINTAPTPTAG